MQSKVHLSLKLHLFLSTTLLLGVAGLAPSAQAALTMNGFATNGLTFNGIRFNSTHLQPACPTENDCKADLVFSPQLQLQGSQLVLHLNR